MADKVYKRTDCSRSQEYQDGLLAKIVPGWPDVQILVDDDLELLTRPTTRQTKDVIYTASLALFGDSEAEITSFLRAAKLRGLKLVCAEESLTWSGGKPIQIVVAQWREARKTGASMRGSQKSAATRKSLTAAKLALIEDDLKKEEFTTRELLDRVGVKSINSIKNHFGVTREVMQGRYRATQKRKERYEQRAN